MSDADSIALLSIISVRLPGDLAFALASGGDVAEDHPLAGEVVALRSGFPASLPYVRACDLLWVTLAPDAESLRRTIEDLRCWIMPSYGWEASPSVVSNHAGAGTMGDLLLRLSPHGYFRWHSRLSDAKTVMARLALLRKVTGKAPARQAALRPTLEMLRRQFTLGLAIGNQDAARNAIDEIDRRQLDTAPNALSMRIRLASAFGNEHDIVEHPQLDDLLSMRLARRVVECVLQAHHAVYLAPAEAVQDIEAALDAYRPIADRLAGLAGVPDAPAEPAIVRMAAYDAALGEDAPSLRELVARFPSDPVVEALAARRHVLGTSLPPSEPLATNSEPLRQTKHQRPLAEPAEARPSTPTGTTTEPVTTPGPVDVRAATAVALDWCDIPALVKADARAGLKAFLGRAELEPDSCDPGDGDFIFELFTDTEIAGDRVRAHEVERVLTTVIDAYICEDLFPRRERMALYRSILDVWSASRASSTDLIDGQLLLTIADALLRLDGKLESMVATVIIRWWETRPVRTRLGWLGEALELLTDQSVSQDYLALWYDGAGLIKADHERLAFVDRHLWHRLGRRLGLDRLPTDEALGFVEPTLEASLDALQGCGFKKIAIVTLHERAAREAARQIEQRTQADIILVTGQAAGEATASAASADVILFVWSAAKHAVYRAFDKVRDRLEYVQGTGSASIVRALERRATATTL